MSNDINLGPMPDSITPVDGQMATLPIEVYELSVRCRGVRKRCRKHEDVFHIFGGLPSFEIPPDIEDKTRAWLNRNFRVWTTANLRLRAMRVEGICTVRTMGDPEIVVELTNAST